MVLVHTRIRTKIGDIFSVAIDDKRKKYFQLIAFDLTQLNSDVIRAFKTVYHSDAAIELSEIVNDEVDFYAHCVTKFGVKLGYWEKAGYAAEIGDITNVLFRNTNDYGSNPEEQVKISNSWHVWRINDSDFTTVGKLTGENRKAEIGIVISPDSIVHRMRTGKYDFLYPDYD